MEVYGRLQQQITEQIRKEIGNWQANTEKKEILASRKMGDQAILERIRELVLFSEMTEALSMREKHELIMQVFHATRKELDVLQPFVEDDQISEIMVNGEENVFIEKKGKIYKTEVKFQSKTHLEETVRRVAAKVHREINESNPIVDARLSDGSRVNAVYSNVALNGPILTIRKFPKTTITMEDLIENETITREAADFLKDAVRKRMNLFISGGTSSGKTTLLNVLTGSIPSEERVVVIEDSAELQVSNLNNVVRLEVKNANVQGKGEVTIRQLIRVAFRMRPDRILVGEVRGAEALDMLQAMNSGHEGSLSTGHANSAQGMLYRLETMILTAENFPLEAVRGQIASAIDLMVHLGRFQNMTRKVLEISQVTGLTDGSIGLNPIFLYREGCLQRTENVIKKKSAFSREI